MSTTQTPQRQKFGAGAPVSFTKLADGEWGVRVIASGTKPEAGKQVTVRKRSGQEKVVTLGELVGVNSYGDYLFRVAPDRQEPEQGTDDLTPITEPGAFEYGGQVYIVKPNREKTRLYAKRVVEAPSDRLNEKGEHVPIELEYERGAMLFLREEHRLDAERAKALTIRYGRCIVCGLKLKVAKSVEAGMGPVCRKRVRNG